MRPPYNYGKLKGKPRSVVTRVGFTSPKTHGEIISQTIPYFYQEVPHSSDRRFTPRGELESEILWKFKLDRLNYIPVECGRYSATFDKHDNIKHASYYYRDKKPLSEEERLQAEECSYENMYNDEGRLIRVIEKHDRNYGNFQRNYQIEKVFDECGRITKETYNDYEQTVYTHNGDLLASKEKFNVVNVNNLFESGEKRNIIYTEVYKYDSNGNLLETLRTSPETDYVSLEKMKYDENGVLVKRVKTAKDNSSSSISRYVLKNNVWYHIFIKNIPDQEREIRYTVSVIDENGNIVLETRMYRKSIFNERKDNWETERSLYTYPYKYTYDKNGNWTRKEYLGEHSTHFVTREIEYYE